MIYVVLREIAIADGYMPVAAYDNEMQANGEVWCIKKYECRDARIVELELNEQPSKEHGK